MAEEEKGMTFEDIKLMIVGDKDKDRRRSVRGGGFFRVIIDLLQDFFG